MHISNSSTLSLVVVARWLTLLAWSCMLVPSQANDKRNILFNIVNQCLNTQVADYCNRCQSPRQEAICEAQTTCKTSIDVWHETSEFVAMRDIKMCGCGPDFVHGLVMPKAKVTGVEDSKRPEAIWSYAWGIAQTKIHSNDKALAVNPQLRRSQDQLHIHIVRLNADARARLNELPLIHVKDLNLVWAAAQKAADELRYSDYGVLLFAASEGGFQMAVTQESPEHAFTQVRCAQ
jgi:CDP-diacylglycerol pyrophosphatase